MATRPGVGVASLDWAVGGREEASAEVAELTRRSLQWLVLTSLVYRVGVTVPAILLNRSVFAGGENVLLVIGLAVLLIDVILIMVTLAHPTWLRTRPVFFAADMAVAVVATVAATLTLPRGMFLVPGADLMTGFGWGTVGLWTVARGWRTGLCLVLATPVLQAAMALGNQAALDRDGVGNLIFRTALAGINYLVPCLIVVAARRTAATVIREAHRAGDLAGRAEHLRGLHDTALADLDAIALLARRGRMSTTERRALIATTAEQRVALATDGTDDEPSVSRTFAAMVASFRERGLAVTLRGPVTPLESVAPPRGDALVGATREALQNVMKHAAVAEAELRVRTSGRTVEVEIRDRGVGSARLRPPGFGLQESIRSRMASVGGEAVVSSAAGAGTTVVLRIDPTSARDLDYVFRWFPLVPLTARLLVLPLIVYKTEPFLDADRWSPRMFVLGLALVHVALIVSGVRRPWPRPTRPILLGLTADAALAACLFLVIAVDLRPGQILTSDGGTVWIYIFLTAPLSFALQQPRMGVAVGLFMIALLPVGLMVDRAWLTGGSTLPVVIYVVQIVFTAAYAAMVAHMAQTGVRQAARESERAGRAAARFAALIDLQPRVVRTLTDIAIRARAPGGDLQEIGDRAQAQAAEVRAVLRRPGPDRGDDGA